MNKQTQAELIEVYNKPVEQQLLGAVIQDGRLFADLPDDLSKHDFSPRHAIVFECMRGVAASGKDIDVITVAEEIQKQRGENFLEYLVDLATNTHGRQVAAYGEALKSKTVDRSLSMLSGFLREIAFDPTLDMHEKLSQAASQLASIDRQESNAASDVNSVLKEAITLLDKKFHDLLPPGLKTGFIDLDAKLEGFQPGELVVLAARPSMGKSALAVNMVEHVVYSGGNALVFSLEMRNTALLNRMLSSVANINSKTIRSGKLREDEWPRLEVAARKIKDKHLNLIEKPSLHVNQVATIVRRFNRTQKLDLVVIDYLQLLSGDAQHGRVQEISQISRTLKAIAKENGVPVIAISQLSRKCEERNNKRPQLSDLRESGQIEQDADVILLLYRDEHYNEDTRNPGVAELNVAKNREGETGRVFLKTALEYSRFENLKANFQPEEEMSYGGFVYE